MGAWGSNRLEDGCNRLIRMLITREFRMPEPLDNLEEELQCAEWVYRYLQSMGITGEPIQTMHEYARCVIAMQDSLRDPPVALPVEEFLPPPFSPDEDEHVKAYERARAAGTGT